MPKKFRPRCCLPLIVSSIVIWLHSGVNGDNIDDGVFSPPLSGASWPVPYPNLTSLTGHVDVVGTTEESEKDFWEYDLSLHLQAYAGLVIIILGLVGNTLCIAVMSKKH